MLTFNKYAVRTFSTPLSVLYISMRRHHPPSLCLSVCLSVCLSIYPSIHPSIYLSVYLSIHPSIPVAPTWSIRESVKRFVSLQFLNLRQSVRLLGRGISPTQGGYLRKRRINADIYPLSGIWTYDPSVRAGEDIWSLRRRSHCDRLRAYRPNIKPILIPFSWHIIRALKRMRWPGHAVHMGEMYQAS
jgi:hypothetical protein